MVADFYSYFFASEKVSAANNGGQCKQARSARFHQPTLYRSVGIQKECPSLRSQWLQSRYRSL